MVRHFFKPMVRKVIIMLSISLGIFTAIFLVLILWQKGQSIGIISPLIRNANKQPTPTPKPLLKYSFENLKKRGGKASEIKLEKILEEQGQFTSYLFSYFLEGRKITGLANIPLNHSCPSRLAGLGTLGSGQTKICKLPVIIMLRGYADREIYKTGLGTKKAGEVLTKDGYITLAPDFLGYGESDMPPNDVWEERFLRPISILDLIESIKSDSNSSSTTLRADAGKIGIWGHSNGGMLALSVLEITGGNYPTTLWAPVSRFFPYDILYYTNEYDDKGKALRKSLADFEKDYETDKYSIDNFYDWIKAPLLIHQGLVDEYIPLTWTNELVDKLKELDKEVDYFVYSGADHNMKGSWNTIVNRDLEFFRKHLKK